MLHASGGELDGKRQPIETRTDRGDGFGVFPGQDEIIACCDGALDEESHRGIVRQVIMGREVFEVRNSQRGHDDIVLSADSQHRSARGQDGKPFGG